MGLKDLQPGPTACLLGSECRISVPNCLMLHPPYLRWTGQNNPFLTHWEVKPHIRPAWNPAMDSQLKKNSIIFLENFHLIMLCLGIIYFSGLWLTHIIAPVLFIWVFYVFLHLHVLLMPPFSLLLFPSVLLYSGFLFVF